MQEENVSQGFHDKAVLTRQTLPMDRKQHRRWYLREWRKHRGYTQDRLAEMTELSKPFLSQLENGKRQYTQELLELFASALNCAPADLIVRDPSDPEGLWSIVDGLAPRDKRRALEVIKAIKRTGTDD